MRMRRVIYILFSILIVMFIVSGCAENKLNDEVDINYQPEEGLPIITITLQDDSQILLELYPEVAENTVNNFISLIDKKFYDGLIFHRVIEGFMIQGGDPEGTGMGGPGYSIDGEFDSNGFKNTLKHTPGVISMARVQDPNSAGSQFFIMHKEYPSLDGKYAAFGKVFRGLDVIDKIVTVETNSKDKPLKDVIMKTVTVDLNGYESKEPEVNN
ncbi:peptidylprolyl isomerase [Clostridium sediminicola]|uniref:peptidylprolyl isomerase n=1 Tax=Clostridium sediminicola TaxID=3114879 RepID=UPI0031F1D02B